jgi:hypothetical protein
MPFIKDQDVIQAVTPERPEPLGCRMALLRRPQPSRALS